MYHLYLRSLRSIKRLQEAAPDGEVAPLGKSLKFLMVQWLCNSFYHLEHLFLIITIPLMNSDMVVNEEEIEY
jgi:hypothetical protein